MKLLDRVNRAKLAAYGTVGVLVLANLALSCALIRESSGRKSVILVPGVPTERRVSAGEPPLESVRDFALLYLAHFDNYTPSTIEETTRYLEGFLSPRFFTQASEALRKRKDLVGQSRMCGQLLLPRATSVTVTRVGDTEYHAKLVATRRIYIADKLQSESALAYSVVVEAGAPTTANPYGLFVTGQAISPYLKSEQEADVRLR